METPWLLQFGATLRRNFFIKIRDASQTFQEIFLPVMFLSEHELLFELQVYIIILLVLLKLIQPEINIPATPWQPKVDALCRPVVPGSQSVCQNLNRRMPSETVLAYVPQGNDLVDEFIRQVAHQFGEEYETPVIVSRSFSTEEDLVNYYKVNPERIYAAIILEGMDGTLEFPEDLKYYIRINGSYVPSEQDQKGRNEECHRWAHKCSVNDYLDSGFLALQSVISQVARKMSLPKSSCSQRTYSKSAFAQQQPLPPYHLSFASKTFQLFTAMYMVWALVPQLQTVLYHTVKEKKDLLKDCMLVMGLRESVYWISWLLTYAAMSVLTSLILVLSAKIARLFAVSDTKVVFLLVYIFSLSLITMAFALSTIFTKVRRALSVSGALMILGSLIIIPVELFQWTPAVCALLSVFSPIGFAVAMNVIVRAEGSGKGLNLHDLWSTSVETDPGDGGSHLSVGMIICVLAIDSVLYILIAWYLDNTWPHPQRGPKRPWNFIVSKKFWFNHKERSYHSVYDQGAHVSWQQPDGPRIEMNASIEFSEEVEYNGGVKDENSNMEQIDPDMASKVAVELQNLRKVYTTRKWWEFWSFDNMIGYRTKRVQKEDEAVKGVSLKFYEGECFAIAGHGGSGKSDILYMLSRLSSCTSGEAYIYGFPISTGGVELKSIVSICPKENICTDLLTAREQLEYFGTIKGIPWHLRIQEGRERKTLKVQIDELLTELNLIEEADKQARELTPPARRKLSLALALVGDPRVVLIDQPTVGLDLESKNQFWNLIRKLQKEFLLIFTTDSMEEADVMADRKAILSHGVVKCCGSSIFLRKRFGLSYLLHIIRGQNYKSEQMLRLIQSHIADTVPVQTPSGQAHSTFRFPLGSSSQMASLLMEITANSAELGVDGGDLEATTLEEIFMKFQDEGEDEAASLEHVSNEKSFEDIDGESESLLGDATSRTVNHKGNVLKMQIRGLLSTRFCLYRRNIVATLTTVGLPAVLTLIALIMQLSFGKVGPQFLDLFDTKIGNSIALFYTTHNESATSDAKILLDKLGTNHVLLNESSLYQRFNVSGLVHQKRLNAIGISFDELDIPDCSFKYTVMYQPWHTHQLPTVAAMLDNAFLQVIQANYSRKPVMNLHCSNHPLPYDEGDDGVSLMVMFAIATGLLFIPPILGAQVVLDKQLGLFGLFRMSGMRTLAYWVAAFFTDILLLYMASFLAVVVGVFFGYSPFIKEAIPIIILLLMVSLPAQLLLSYVLSFMFDSAQGALSASSVICLLGAIIPYFILFIAPGGQLSSLGWHTLFSVVDPAYNLISSLHMVFSSVREIKGQNGFLPSSASTILYFFRWNNFIMLSVLGSLISILLLLLCLWRLESHMLNPESRDIHSHGTGESSEVAVEEQETEDVELEKEKVQSTIAARENLHPSRDAGEHGGDQILCCGMSKKFSTSGMCSSGSNEGTWAFKNIWLAVQQGEIVVLVGGEKAGKSTLLNCLGRQCSITYGDAIVCGNSVRYNYWGAQQNVIGFCPQYALVYPALTLREHLKLFASLKGLANHNIPVEAILNALNLTEEADKRLGHCKPAIHNKLAIATAMLGDPNTLLLDEPTCGLDTASKRKIWTYIAAQSSSHATLICTQSSEEAEALGKRVGILVKGQLKCLAAPQELKRRYGSAYSLVVMGETDKMEAINNFVSTLFPLSENETSHEDNSCSPVMGQWRQKRFQIQIRNLSELAMLLHELEIKRHTFGIKEFIVSQPTLQQVFHRIIHANEGSNHT
ncbi:uncharacterized protein LOC131027665 isoform X3 [Cryptomeria japonica]|uniref:uncharacterized protein LOC131027665 isoform X3 n=1 Tax=Cryptomeria japonica TaxID=3369 RepID=UPI0025AC7C08|nr:uncharacterized protein LOC131027665 isoform X3 [Cryptomeria japonica]